MAKVDKAHIEELRFLLQESRSYIAGLTSLAEYAIGQDCPKLHELLAKIDAALVLTEDG